MPYLMISALGMPRSESSSGGAGGWECEVAAASTAAYAGGAAGTLVGLDDEGRGAGGGRGASGSRGLEGRDPDEAGCDGLRACTHMTLTYLPKAWSCSREMVMMLPKEVGDGSPRKGFCNVGHYEKPSRNGENLESLLLKDPCPTFLVILVMMDVVLGSSMFQLIPLQLETKSSICAKEQAAWSNSDVLTEQVP